MTDGRWYSHLPRLWNDQFSAISFCVALSIRGKIHHKPIQLIYPQRTFLYVFCLNVSPSKFGGVFSITSPHDHGTTPISPFPHVLLHTIPHKKNTKVKENKQKSDDIPFARKNKPFNPPFQLHSFNSLFSNTTYAQITSRWDWHMTWRIFLH